MNNQELIEMAFDYGAKKIELATLEINSGWEEKINGFLAYWSGSDTEAILQAEFDKYINQGGKMDEVIEYLKECDLIRYCEACGEFHNYEETEWCEDCDCCKEGCEEAGDCEAGIERREQAAHDEWVDSEIDRMKEEREDENDNE